MATVDPDNPLPEASFPWRRTITIGASLCLLGSNYLALERLPPGDLLAFTQGNLVLQLIVWLLYFGGASAEEITRLIATLRLRLGPQRPPGQEDLS